MTEKLTREEAIRLHRAMWNWIADVIEKIQHVQDIDFLKCKFTWEITPCQRIPCNCYCCAFACNNDNVDGCILCPLDWGTDHEDDFPCEKENGLWVQCRDCTNWGKQAALARKIANLPDRKVNKDDVL